MQTGDVPASRVAGVAACGVEQDRTEPGWANLARFNRIDAGRKAEASMTTLGDIGVDKVVSTIRAGPASRSYNAEAQPLNVQCLLTRAAGEKLNKPTVQPISMDVSVSGLCLSVRLCVHV